MLSSNKADSLRRLKSLILSCEGRIVGEAAALYLNKQYDSIHDINVVFNSHARKIFLSVLQIDYKVIEAVDSNEFTLYPDTNNNASSWDCLHLYLFSNIGHALKNAYFDIDYLSLTSKSIHYYNGCYYMRFIKDLVETMLERVQNRRFCLSYPHRTAKVMMRSLSMLAKGWTMDDFLLPEKSIVLVKINTPNTLCKKCNSTIRKDDTATIQSQQQSYCIPCSTQPQR